MKSIRVNKKWVKDFEEAQTQTEELQVFYDFFFQNLLYSSQKII